MICLALYTLVSLAIGVWCEYKAPGVQGEHPALRALWALSYAVLWPIFLAWTVYAVFVNGEDPEDLDW